MGNCSFDFPRLVNTLGCISLSVSREAAARPYVRDTAGIGGTGGFPCQVSCRLSPPKNARALSQGIDLSPPRNPPFATNFGGCSRVPAKMRLKGPLWNPIPKKGDSGGCL